MRNIIKKIIAIKISSLLIFQQTVIAGSIVVDNTAVKSNQATLETARNGVPIVNIVVPNEKGLSHNKFSDYNVNKEGVILNNSNQRDVNTQLSGYIYGNKNLVGGSTAKTILNEVTSKNKSELKGFTEVAGDKAGVVVANPNGIYINGAGFINTSKATITTGKINIQDNQIRNFEVRDSEIQIDGDGLNTTNVDKAELYAKTVKLNAQIHAKDIDIVTGKNKISEDGTIERIDEVDTEKPSFSLDSSSLGGIYANKINLIGTQAGVGVNLPVEIAAQDNLKLSADGKIVVKKVIATNDINIKSNSNSINSEQVYANNVNLNAKNEIVNADMIASKNNIELTAQKVINNNIIASGVTEELEDSIKGNLTINSENLENKKTLYSKDNITIDSTNIKNSQNSNINSKKAIIIKSKNLENEDNVTIQSKDDITIKSEDKIVSNNTKILSQEGNLSLNAKKLELNKSIVNVGKDIDLKVENEILAQDVNMQGNKIDISSKSLELSKENTKEEDYNSKLISNTSININTNSLKNINGYIGAKEDINIESKDIDNSNGVIVTNENLNINSEENGMFNNVKGIIQAGKRLVLNIFNFQGEESNIQAKEIEIIANDVNAKSSNIVATDGDLGLKTNNLDLDNSLQIAALKDLKIDSKETKLNNTKILSQEGNLSLNAKKLELNKSIVNVGKDIDLKVENEILAQDVNMQGNKIDISSKSLELSKENTKEEDYNSKLISNTSININTNSLKNINGYIGAKEDINIESKDIDNSNGVIVTNENLNINSEENGMFNNVKGIIQAGKRLVLNIFNFQGEESNIQAKEIEIIANDVNAKSSNIVATDGDLGLKTNNLDFSSEITNKGLLYSTNNILINSKKFISNYLSIQANNNIDINSLDITLNNSIVQSVVDINETYANGYKQGNINLITNKLDLNNTTLASKDLNIKNQKKNKLEKLIVNNSTLDVNNDINILTTNFNTKDSKYLSLRNFFLQTNNIENEDSNTILSNNVFKSGNSMNITIDDDITLDSSNTFEALNSVTLNSKSLTNNAQFISNDNITINANDYIINNALLSSGNTITLNANNYIINNDSNETLFGIKGAFTNLNTNILTNYGLISSLYEMNLKANDIVNYGGIASGNADNYSSIMSITANNLTNYNTIYSNDSVNLFIKNNLLNKTDDNLVDLNNKEATIYATNHINIQADKDKTLRTQNITNDKSVIQTQYGDINIFANKLENLAIELNIKGEYIQENNGSMSIRGGERISTEYISRDKPGYTYNSYTIYTDIMSYDKPIIAQILSGRDIYFNTNTIINNYSLISGKNDLYFESDVISNDNIDIVKLTTTNKAIYTREKKCKWYGSCKEYSTYKGTQVTYDVEIVDTISSSIEAGRNIFGTSNSLINGNENAIIEFSTYKPTTNTDIVSSDLSIITKNTQNETSSSTGIIVANTQKEELDNTTTKTIEEINTQQIVNSNETDVKDTQKEELAEEQNKEIEFFEKEKIESSIDKIVENNDSQLLNKDNLNINIAVETIKDDYKLPTNKFGIFTPVDPNKNLDYLVESNPLYTDLSNYTGSSYFLEKMNYQGDRTTKRLGDAAYETKLVSQAIIQQTGQRFLSENYTSENAQFVALMGNAVNMSGVLELEIGKALTPIQLSNLSEDIVWMEEKIVDGQSVLVPVVYLAKDYEHLKGASIVAGNSIDLKVNSNVNNSGVIKAKDYINLDANSIINNSGVILSNGKASLISINDFVNKNGGIIKGSDVQIASLNGNIINETFLKQNTINQGTNNFTYTLLGNQSQIEATNGNLVIQANKNIDNIGSSLSASKILSLNAINEDVNLKTIELKNEHNLYFGGGFDKALDMEYLAATASAGENVIMKSGNDINLEVSKLNAVNQINLNASNDVNITAVNNVHYTDVQTSSKGFMSKKTQRDMSYKEEVVSSELNANDIVINANNNVNLEASKLKAQDNIIVNAKEGDVNILAKEYREGELHQTSKSSFGGLKKSLDISSSDALKLNSALLETQAANVVISSGKDINILASEINSGNLLLADAKNNLNIMSDEEIFKQEEIHKKTSFSPSFSGNMLVYAQEKTNSDKNLTTTQIASNLSGKEVMLQAQNELTIIGSNVVGEDITLKANDINLLSATQSASNEHSESTKKIGVEVTLNSKEASIFAGGIVNKDEINKGNTTQLASNIVGDNVTLISKDNTNIMASNIMANNDLILATGKNINVLSQEATDYKDKIHTYLKAGISLGVKQNITDGAKNIANSAQSIAKSDNAANAGFGTLKLIDTVSSTLSNPVSAGLNAVAIVNKNTSSSTNQTVQSSNIYAGNNATFVAGEDVNIKGSNVYSQNNLDIYAKNLNVEASAEKSNSKTTDKNMDLSVGLYGTNAGKVDLSVSQAKQTSQSTNYVNSNIQAKNLNLNIDNNAKFEGANIQAKDINATVGNNLTIASLQNSSNSNGSSSSLSLGTSGNGSIGVGVGKNNSQRDWVDNQTTIIGTNSVNVNVQGDTLIKGAVIASGNYDENGNFVDKNNLNLSTKSLSVENINDKDKSSSYNLSVGVDKSENETQAKMELGLSNSQKEQINYATIGNGNIEVKDRTDISNVNRDVNQSQVITKDKNSNLDIYLSNTSISKALDPTQTIAKWGQDSKDLGLNVRNEIMQNLPSATKLDKDGNGNIFDKTIGKALDATTDYGMGIIPTVGNAGGYVTQIATQLFGDNRGIIKTANKQDLLNMGINPEDIYPTGDGKYVTDPNKTVVILKDEEAIKKEQKLSDFNDSKIYLTQEQTSKITHMFTNGIMNDTKDSFENSKEQTGNASVVFINYNQTHGIVGDLMESGQDKFFVNTLGQSYLLTGSARQTSDYLVNLAQATNGNLIVDAHSQGSLLTYAAMLNAKSDLQNILKDKKDTTLKVGFYGSPVNSDDSSSLVRQLYLNSSVYTNTDIKVSDYFRSSVNPGDPVGSISIFLGGNGAGINSSSKSEGESFYVWFERGAKTMFNGKNPEDLKNSSPHSGYVCVIGCGDGMLTPQFGDYVKEDKTTESLNNFYDERNLNKGFANFNQWKNNENK
ncbi:hypothetical protein CKA56_15435 [Arcobacter venerupis]|uniref:two-partner secretion domain-containing protein n=1 Tax=Arcobacter venerupis TaxID=1054033 RepID=UPI000FEB6986|nr:hemagglutinin repeat-containing protein [Arcobacter venerupis]RWS48202.1 hypothetical protein CKA56_15435 [Arcobacter venerupis]